MNDINNILNKVSSIIRSQWKLSILTLMIVVLSIATIFIPGDRKYSETSPRAGSGNKDSLNPDSETTNNQDNGIFSFFNKEKEAQVSTAPLRDKKLNNIYSGSINAALPESINKLDSNGNSIPQQLKSQDLTNTSQGSINVNSSIQKGVESNDQRDKISISFKNPDGSITEYIPPGTPSEEIRWGRYSNNKHGYEINFPVNWQFTYYSDINGDEKILIYPPKSDPNNPDSHYIGFGYSQEILNIADTELSDAYKSELLVDGVEGSTYTNGSLGPSYITSILNYLGGNFVLKATKSDETFAYVYYYMLYSLTFDN